MSFHSGSPAAKVPVRISIAQYLVLAPQSRADETVCPLRAQRPISNRRQPRSLRLLNGASLPRARVASISVQQREPRETGRLGGESG